MFARLLGKKKDDAAEVSSAEAAAGVSPNLDLTEHSAAPGAATAPAVAGPSARQQAFTKQFGVSASDQLYNPYDGEFAMRSAIGSAFAAGETQTLHPWETTSVSAARLAAGRPRRAAAGTGHTAAAAAAACLVASRPASASDLLSFPHGVPSADSLVAPS